MPNKTKEQISYNMSRIRSSGTKIEIRLGRALWSVGIRYRKNYKKVLGKPDFVSVKYKTAIFCDSAFWHGYKQMKTKIHNFKSNNKFWEEKIRRNIKRDKEVTRKLRKDNWKVIRFWDFQINKDADACARKVLCKINKGD